MMLEKDTGQVRLFLMVSDENLVRAADHNHLYLPAGLLGFYILHLQIYVVTCIW